MIHALETRNVAMKFGALTVANDINFTLEQGARHALIGPNGAGKTTFVNLLTGRFKPASGQIFVEGEDVTMLTPSRRVRKGIGRTFQINTLFKDLSVLDNVAIAVAERRGIAGRMFRPANRQKDVIAEVKQLLAVLGLADEQNRSVRDLPYGKQRLVEIGIALGLQPKILLLDEPAAGVPSHESHLIFDVLAALPSEISILFIEHDMDLVFRFAKKITVLAAGSILTEGTPAEIKVNPKVREVYLGEAYA